MRAAAVRRQAAVRQWKCARLRRRHVRAASHWPLARVWRWSFLLDWVPLCGRSCARRLPMRPSPRPSAARRPALCPACRLCHRARRGRRPHPARQCAKLCLPRRRRPPTRRRPRPQRGQSQLPHIALKSGPLLASRVLTSHRMHADLRRRTLARLRARRSLMPRPASVPSSEPRTNTAAPCKRCRTRASARRWPCWSRPSTSTRATKRRGKR